jgi:glycine cleavage system transcriptional repressor
VTTLAITVIGADRPGIITRVASALAGHGMNLTDSSMTVLSGHLAMTLICIGDSPIDDVRAAMDQAAGDDLIIHVHPVDDSQTGGGAADSYLLTVHGADRLGIVARVTGVIAAVDGNITDLTTHLVGGLYVLAAEVDLPAGTDVADLRSRISAVAAELGVEAGLQALERDEL